MQSREFFESIVKAVESVSGQETPRAGLDDFNRLVVRIFHPVSFGDQLLLVISHWEQDGLIHYTMFVHANDDDGGKRELEHYTYLSQDAVVVTIMYWLSHNANTRAGAEVVRSLIKLLG